MLLGALVLISPWSGIPMSWLEWILVIIGLAIIGIALTLRPRDEAPHALPPPPAESRPEPQPRSSHIAFS